MSVMMLLVALGLAVTATAGETAREILDRRKALDETTQHWDDRYQKMKLRIVDGKGSERSREIQFYERREPNDERKTLMVLLAPAEVKGIGFLSHNHKERAADQWLYLPEFQRSRKITARTKNERFVASDLTYHDLELISELPTWSEDDAASKLRGEETLGEVACHVIELAPQREDIAYKRIVVWIGRDDLSPRKLEFYAGETEPAKRIELSDVRRVSAIPLAHRARVETPSAGSRTEIEVEEAGFNEKLDAEMFTQRTLERGGR